MKKDVFADWLREFCMLVFIQSVQAFIFAIVMSLLISVFSGEFADEDGAAASTGVICIVILASVSKLEAIVTKIFGIKSGFHDSGMRGGLKSLATTMMAGKLAKGALDNVGKVTGGVTGIIGANKGIATTRARMARDLNKNTNQQSGGKVGKSPELPSPTSDDYMNKAKDAKASGDMRAYERNRALAAGMNKQSKALSTSGGGSGKGSFDMQKKMDEYDDKIKELKKQRRQGIVGIASGLTETAGAAVGGVIGMAGGAALGEGREIIQGGLAGIGIGDAVGKAAVNAPANVAGTVRTLTTDTSEWIRSNKTFKKEMSDYQSATKNAIGLRDAQTRTVRDANRKLKKAFEDINAGNME